MLWNELALHIAGVKDCCQDIWFAELSSHVVSRAAMRVRSSSHAAGHLRGGQADAVVSRGRLPAQRDRDVEEVHQARRPSSYVLGSRFDAGCLFVVEGAVSGFMSHLCEHTYYLCTNRQQCMYEWEGGVMPDWRASGCFPADCKTKSR